MRQSPSIAEKVAFLARPAAYSHGPASVDVEETHMSWVFLAGDRVFKMKKPVRYDFLDFGTLEARAFFVAEEVRLNVRLAPEVYRGAVRLTCAADGTLALGGEGRTVEWLVEMNRLPAERMLDAMIARDAVVPAQIRTLAARLSAFYAGLPPAGIAPEAHVARFADQHRETARVLTDRRFRLDGPRVAAAVSDFESDIAALGPLLVDRVRSGHVIEGHGDLRPEHVCIGEPPAVIDCLEFDRSLRLLDPFEEIAFLGMECARLGAGWIFPLLREGLSEGLSDRPPPRLIAFYWRYRALLRARLALSHLYEPTPRKPAKWRPLALRYIAMAEAAALSPLPREAR